MRGYPVVGLAVPGRKLQHRQIGAKNPAPGPVAAGAAVAADTARLTAGGFGRAAGCAREIRDDQAFGALGDVARVARVRGKQFGGRSVGASCVGSPAKRLDAVERRLAYSGAGGMLPVSAA